MTTPSSIIPMLREAFSDKPVWTSLVAVAISYSCYSSLAGINKLLRSLGLLPSVKPDQKPCNVSANKKLQDHCEEFGKKEIISVTEGVWVAIGYGLANSILIEGTDGLIVIDCMESVEASEDIMQDFQKICKKPVCALIYSHNHTDHIGGARGFLKYAINEACDIYANIRTEKIIQNFYVKSGPISFMRAARQFGQFLPSNQHINSGIGPCLRGVDQETPIDLVFPTVTFDQELSVCISGVDIQLLHAPGETDDQIVIYLPRLKLLCPADNIYKAFPNLYAIRGTPVRDAHVWAQSLEMMRHLKSDFMVPSHTRPVVGASEIDHVLSIYRDAVLFVHDQTVRLMNRGYFLNDVVEKVNLPPHLRDHPYLQEFYGTVEWSVRGIFTAYLGWFSGDPAELHSLNPKTEATRMVQLAGGIDKLLNCAEDAVNSGDFQWGLVCAQHVLRYTSDDAHTIISGNHFDLPVTTAKQLAVRSLQGLAEREVSANGRNYYLTYALELSGTLPSLQPSATLRDGVLKTMNGIDVIKMLPIRLDPKKSENVDKKVLYSFPDIERSIIIEIRQGVARTIETDLFYTLDTYDSTAIDLIVTVDSSVFVEIARKVKNKTSAVLNGEMKSVGRGVTSAVALKKFMDLFDDSDSVFIPPH